MSMEDKLIARRLAESERMLAVRLQGLPEMLNGDAVAMDAAIALADSVRAVSRGMVTLPYLADECQVLVPSGTTQDGWRAELESAGYEICQILIRAPRVAIVRRMVGLSMVQLNESRSPFYGWWEPVADDRKTRVVTGV